MHFLGKCTTVYLLMSYCFMQCCRYSYYNRWERSCQFCISKLSWFAREWKDNCEKELSPSYGSILQHFLFELYLNKMNCRIHALVHWIHMVLDLVVLVVFMGLSVKPSPPPFPVLHLLFLKWKSSSKFKPYKRIALFLDVHLDCEAKIAKFLGTPDSILYSYGISTIFSVIPAFAKKGDIIVAWV